MLISMTGFGRGESKNENIHVVAELRSVNNRFLDINFRLPKALSAYENDIKEIVRKQISRGRISLSVTLQAAEIDRLDVQVDYNTASNYKSMLEELKNRLGLGGEIKLQHILNFSEIFTSIEENTADEKIWKYAKKAIILALDEMNQMKRQEGKNLGADLLKRLQKMNTQITKIKEISRKNIPVEFDNLKSRIKEILGAPDIDAARLEMEIAILADRLDVTEECVRFGSHIQLFEDLIKNDGFAGRRLNFLCQEMNREANTIGSKCNNAEIAHLVVFIKEEIERIREQVQNVE